MRALLTRAVWLRSKIWQVFNQGYKSLMRRLIPRRIRRATVTTGMRLWARTLPWAECAPASSDVKQILVFGDMGLGNFLMFTPTLEALRKGFPRAEIVALFLKARGAEVIARGNPSIDRMIVVDMPKRAGFGAFGKLTREAAEADVRPDMVVARWNGSPYVALLTLWLRPKFRVGHISSGGFTGYCDAVFNFPVAMDESRHEVDRNLDLAVAAGVSPPAKPTMFMPVEDIHVDQARALLRSRQLDPSRLICLQTGSSELQKWKRWPESHWARLAVQLVDRGWEIAFLGSKDEAKIARHIVEGTPFIADFDRINLCGRLSINATAALLEQSRGIICNDSGLMHVAAAVGTPIIALFGPTEFDRTRPFTEDCVVLRKACLCNHGTLFDRATLARIEGCERLCLKGTLPSDVLTVVDGLFEVPDEAPRAVAGQSQA
jgi:lipopolysaccharide heptosyltransferase II